MNSAIHQPRHIRTTSFASMRLDARNGRMFQLPSTSEGGAGARVFRDATPEAGRTFSLRGNFRKTVVALSTNPVSSNRRSRTSEGGRGPQLAGDLTPETARTSGQERRASRTNTGGRLANLSSSSRRSRTLEGGRGPPACWGSDPGDGPDFFATG